MFAKNLKYQLTLVLKWGVASFTLAFAVSAQADPKAVAPVNKNLTTSPSVAQPLETDKKDKVDKQNDYHTKALAAYKSGNYEEALKVWSAGVKAGDKDAEHFLGVFYLVGDENMKLKQDHAKALALLQKSAASNQAESQRMLASAYMDGTLVEKDIKKSVALYEQAATNGSALAQFDLAGFYLNGENVEKSVSRALDLYERAAKLGNAQAELVLAAFYFKGEHVKQDKKEALRRFELLANRSDAQGQFFLAVYKLEEEQDKIEAYKWSKLSLQNKGTRSSLSFFQALKNNMTPAEILEAETRIKNWKPKPKA